MYYKEQNGKLIAPPVNFQTENGVIINFNLNKKAMKKYGYKDYTQEQIEQFNREHLEVIEQNNNPA